MCLGNWWFTGGCGLLGSGCFIIRTGPGRLPERRVGFLLYPTLLSERELMKVVVLLEDSDDRTLDERVAGIQCLGIVENH
jgi:hypothetical protein